MELLTLRYTTLPFDKLRPLLRMRSSIVIVTFCHPITPPEKLLNL
jgi:hypothetical protein